LNLFSVGPLEGLVIMLVAFLALGPNKSIEMARTAGRVIRDLRRTFDEVVSAVNLDGDDEQPPPRNASRRPSETKDDSQSPTRNE
jgi:Sec-independent protein translocase protein TatA